MNIDFYPSEADPIEYIEKLAYKQGYIKALLRADMERTNKKGRQTLTPVPLF